MIEFDVAGRASGKTERMFDWLLEAPAGENRILVSHAEARALVLRRRARDRELPLEAWQFVGVHSLSPKCWVGCGGRVVLGVDDLDLSLPGLVGWEIGRVTATGELATNGGRPLTDLVRELTDRDREELIGVFEDWRSERETLQPESCARVDEWLHVLKAAKP